MRKILYHIHKKGNFDNIWKIGNDFEIGLEKNNPFIDFAINFEAKIPIKGEFYPYLNVYNYYKAEKSISEQLELLDISERLINEYQILIREIALEKVRENEFSKLPSRKHCIWLCRKNQIDYWKQFFSGEFEIFEVEIFQEYFKSRNSLLPLPADSYINILKQANLYWKYDEDKENKDDEYLYVGKLKIIDKCI